MTTTPPKKTRAALYARISTADRQDVSLQVAELRAAALARGLDVVGEFIDRGVSGARDRRPGLDQMLERVRAGEIDVVMFSALDRLGRSLRHLVTLFDELRELGVDVVCVRQPIDTTSPVGVLIYQVLAAVAEFERALIRERVRIGVRAAIARGKQVGRPRRWTQEQVERARRLRAAGKSWRQVAMAVHLPVRTVRRALTEAFSGGAVAKG